MKKKWKILTVVFCVLIIAAVPIIASPLVINKNKNFSSLLESLTEIENPSSEKGWIKFIENNTSKQTSEFRKIQDYIDENTYRVDTSTEKGVKELDDLIKGFENHIRNSDEIQYFTAYWLRASFGKIKLAEMNPNNSEYQLTEKDIDNLNSLHSNRELSNSSDQQIMDALNQKEIKIGGIKITSTLNPLIDKVYKEFQKQIGDSDDKN